LFVPFYERALLERLETNDFKNKLMRDHATLIHVTYYADVRGFKDAHLFLQGAKAEVETIKALLAKDGQGRNKEALDDR